MQEEKTEETKYQTTVVFSKQDTSKRIGGQARIEGFNSMGEFIEFLFEKHMRQK